MLVVFAFFSRKNVSGYVNGDLTFPSKPFPLYKDYL